MHNAMVSLSKKVNLLELGLNVSSTDLKDSPGSSNWLIHQGMSLFEPMEAKGNLALCPCTSDFVAGMNSANQSQPSMDCKDGTSLSMCLVTT